MILWHEEPPALIVDILFIAFRELSFPLSSTYLSTYAACPRYGNFFIKGERDAVFIEP